ncbi:hypothetical protein I79_005916 [Cricetulus griseus]|uniref:Uncharacterized protein n=1 Tax=Cricetulus griseus TaxID=10029 RepID=G3H6F8_CRIGR|nr:hypothetical protein I79_005916 [Cricetulus griseus]
MTSVLHHILQEAAGAAVGTAGCAHCSCRGPGFALVATFHNRFKPKRRLLTSTT